MLSRQASLGSAPAFFSKSADGVDVKSEDGVPGLPHGLVLTCCGTSRTLRQHCVVPPFRDLSLLVWDLYHGSTEHALRSPALEFDKIRTLASFLE